MTGVYDVTEAFSDLLVAVVIKHHSAGAYIEGKWVEGAVISTPAKAVAHPMSENQINQLNIEGYHGRELLKFYFTSANVVDITDNSGNTTADEISYAGQSYTVLKKDDWDYQGGYFLVYAERSVKSSSPPIVDTNVTFDGTDITHGGNPVTFTET